MARRGPFLTVLLMLGFLAHANSNASVDVPRDDLPRDAAGLSYGIVGEDMYIVKFKDEAAGATGGRRLLAEEVGTASEALLERLRQTVADVHAARVAAYEAATGSDGGGKAGGSSGVSAKDKGKAAAGRPADPVLEVETVYQAVFPGFAGRLSDDVATLARNDPTVEYVDEQKIVRIAGFTQSSPPWNLDRIDQRVWPPKDCSYSYNSSGCGVNVYVVDTGIYPGHPEFEGRAQMAWQYYNDSTDPNSSDCNGHGTHCAGTIGSKSYGVAKQVNIFGVKVLSCSGSGTDGSVIAGIDWVTRHHVKPAIISMSLGGGSSPSLNAAVEAATNASIIVVVAAGNENSDACEGSPSSAPSAITVGATSSTDTRASFSNFGSCVDIFAPGVGIPSTWIGGTGAATNTISGTSMATPLVAGTVALYLEAFPTATVPQVTEALKAAGLRNATSDVGPASPNLFVQSLGLIPDAYQMPTQCQACRSPCLNMGRCVQGSCACTNGFAGPSCETYAPWTFAAAQACSSASLTSGTNQVATVTWTYTGREGRPAVTLSLVKVPDTAAEAPWSLGIDGAAPNPASGGTASFQWTVPAGLQGYYFYRITNSDSFYAESSSGRFYIASGCGGPVLDTCTAAMFTGDISTTDVKDSYGRRVALFRFQATTTRSVTFSTCNAGTSYDTLLTLYRGCPAADGATQLAQNDDYSACTNSLTSQLTYSLVEGQSYYVGVVGYNGAVGRFTLSVKDSVCNPDSALPGPTPAPSTSPVVTSVPAPTITPPPAATPPPPPPTPPPVQCTSFPDVGSCPAAPIAGSNAGMPSVIDSPHSSGEAVYSFVPSQTGWKTFSLCSPNTTFDTVLYVFRGCPTFDSVPLASNNDGCGISSTNNNAAYGSWLRAYLTAGLQYTIVIEGQGAAEGSFELTVVDHACAGAPTCAAASVVEPCGGILAGTTAGRPDLLQRWEASGEEYFTFSVPTARTVNVSLCSQLTNFDSYVHVFDGCPIDGSVASRVAFDDDGCGGSSLASHLSFSAQADVRYVIALEGYASRAGSFALRVTDSYCATSETPTPAPTPPPPEVVVTPSPSALPTPTPSAAPTPSATPRPTAAPTPPASCDGLVPFAPTCAQPSVVGSTVGARNRMPRHASGEAIYSFSLPESKTITLQTCGRGTNFDTVLYAYRRDPCPVGLSTATAIAYSDDSCGSQSSITLAVEANVAYVVVVEGYASAVGNFTLAYKDATCPVPDNCGLVQPAELQSCGGPVAGSTVGLPRLLPASAVPTNWAGFTGGETFYKFTLPYRATVGVSLCDATASSFDTVLYAFAGCPLNSSSPGPRVAQNDDGCPASTRSQLSFVANASVEYWVVVGGYNAASGSFTMRVTDSVCGVTPTPAPTPPPAPTAAPAPLATPPPDSPCGATQLNVCTNVRGSTVGAPNRYTNFAPSGERIFAFVPPRAGTPTYRFSTCNLGTTYDTYISLHRGCPIGPNAASSVLVASNDDSCGGRSSQVSGALAYNVVHYLVVEGYSYSAGNFSLTATYGDSSCGTVTRAAAAASPDAKGDAEDPPFAVSQVEFGPTSPAALSFALATSTSASQAAPALTGPAADCGNLPALAPCKAATVSGSTFNSPSRFFPGYSGVAYTLRVPTTRTLALTLCGNNPPSFDAMLGVLAGCSLATFTFDHSGCGEGRYGSSVQGTFTAGVAYQILVEGWTPDAAGSFGLTIDSKNACNEAPPSIHDVDDSIASGVPVITPTARTPPVDPKPEPRVTITPTPPPRETERPAAPSSGSGKAQPTTPPAAQPESGGALNAKTPAPTTEDVVTLRLTLRPSAAWGEASAALLATRLAEALGISASRVVVRSATAGTEAGTVLVEIAIRERAAARRHLAAAEPSLNELFATLTRLAASNSLSLGSDFAVLDAAVGRATVTASSLATSSVSSSIASSSSSSSSSSSEPAASTPVAAAAASSSSSSGGGGGLPVGVTAGAAAGAAVAAVAAVVVGIAVYRRYRTDGPPAAAHEATREPMPGAYGPGAAPISTDDVIFIGGSLEVADSVGSLPRRRGPVSRSGSGISRAGSAAGRANASLSRVGSAVSRSASGVSRAGSNVVHRSMDYEEDTQVEPFAPPSDGEAGPHAHGPKNQFVVL